MAQLDERLQAALQDMNRLIVSDKVASSGDGDDISFVENLLDEIESEWFSGESTNTQPVIVPLLHVLGGVRKRLSHLGMTSAEVMSPHLPASNLTVLNVAINSRWEVIVSTSEKMLFEQLYSMSVKEDASFRQLFKHHCKLVRDIRGGDLPMNILWNYYDANRRQKLAAINEEKNSYENWLRTIKMHLRDDLSLLNEGVFNPLEISLKDILLPYEEIITNLIEIASESEVDSEWTMACSILTFSNAYDDILIECEKEFCFCPHSDWHLCHLQDGMVKKGFAGRVFRLFNAIGLHLLNLDTELIVNANSDLQVIGTISQFFQRLEESKLFKFEKFRAPLFALIELNLTDFFQHQLDANLNVNSRSLDSTYLLLNSIYFAENEMMTHSIDVHRLSTFEEVLESDIKQQSSLLNTMKCNINYWIIYLDRLRITMHEKLCHASSAKLTQMFSTIFIDSLTKISRDDLTIDECSQLLRFIIASCPLQKSSSESSRQSFRYPTSLICAKMIFSVAPILDLQQYCSQEQNFHGPSCFESWFDALRRTVLGTEISRHSNPQDTQQQLTVLLEKKARLSLEIISRESNEVERVDLCHALFLIASLHSPPILSKVILTQLHQSDVLISESLTCWWYQAIERLLKKYVAKDLEAIIIKDRICFDSLIQAQTSFKLLKLYATFGMSHDPDLTVKECASSIIQLLINVATTLPERLLCAFNEIENNVDMGKLLFNSFTGQLLFSSSLRHIETEFGSCQFGKALHAHLLKMVSTKNVEATQQFSSVKKARHSSLVAVSASEDEQLALTTSFVDNDDLTKKALDKLSTYFSKNCYRIERDGYNSIDRLGRALLDETGRGPTLSVHKFLDILQSGSIKTVPRSTLETLMKAREAKEGVNL